jgi:hypothetical protein
MMGLETMVFGVGLVVFVIVFIAGMMMFAQLEDTVE